MKDWLIVKSKSGVHHEFGYPLGEILCRHPEDVPQVIKDHAIHDPIVTKYMDEMGED